MLIAVLVDHCELEGGVEGCNEKVLVAIYRAEARGQALDG
jgi:hypothetical protein